VIVEDVLTKPFTLADLRSAVREVLERRGVN
jgi:DNA-binding response OmpR family regulator